MAEAKKKRGGERLLFLDWMRGLAAVIMIPGHAFHSFTKPELRESGPYVISQFIGGMPPAMFLFLVGVTLAFNMHSRQRAGLGPGQRVIAALRRAGYLFMLALAFRLSLWILGWPTSPTRELLRVDILNAMGFAVAVFSIMAVFQTADRVRLCAGLGVVIAAGAPLVSQFDWSGVPVFIRQYIVPDYAAFAFFPWAAFVAFGMSAGSLIRLLEPEKFERAAQWAAILGMAMIFSGQYFSNMPYSLYTRSEFWLDGPWLIIIKLGVLLLILAFSFLWTRHSGTNWSWIRQFGVTSLLVYWVHIELMYGRWLWFLKEQLTVGQTVAAAAAFMGLMLLISVARTNWKNWRTLGLSMGWHFFLFRRAPEQ